MAVDVGAGDGAVVGVSLGGADVCVCSGAGIGVDVGGKVDVDATCVPAGRDSTAAVGLTCATCVCSATTVASSRDSRSDAPPQADRRRTTRNTNGILLLCCPQICIVIVNFPQYVARTATSQPIVTEEHEVREPLPDPGEKAGTCSGAQVNCGVQII